MTQEPVRAAPTATPRPSGAAGADGSAASGSSAGGATVSGSAGSGSAGGGAIASGPSSASARSSSAREPLAQAGQEVLDLLLPRRERRGLEDVRLGLGLRRLRPAPLGGRELLPLQRLHPVTQLRDLPFERQAPALGGLAQRSLDGRALEPLALELRLHLAPSDLDLADSQLGLGQRFARLADQLEDGSAGRARSLLVGHDRTELVPQSLQRTLDLALHDRALLELGLELLRPLGLLGQPAVGDLHELALELGPLALERRAVALALSLEPALRIGALLEVCPQRLELGAAALVQLLRLLGHRLRRAALGVQRGELRAHGLGRRHQLRDDPLALDPRLRGGPFGDLGLHRLCGLDRVRDLATGLRDLLARLAHPIHPTLGRGLQLGHTGLDRAAGGVSGRDLLLGLGGAPAQPFELGRGLARTTLGAVEPATDVQHLLLRAVRAPRSLVARLLAQPLLRVGALAGGAQLALALGEFVLQRRAVLGRLLEPELEPGALGLERRQGLLRLGGAPGLGLLGHLGAARAMLGQVLRLGCGGLLVGRLRRDHRHRRQADPGVTDLQDGRSAQRGPQAFGHRERRLPAGRGVVAALLEARQRLEALRPDHEHGRRGPARTPSRPPAGHPQHRRVGAIAGRRHLDVDHLDRTLATGARVDHARIPRTARLYGSNRTAQVAYPASSEASGVPLRESTTAATAATIARPPAYSSGRGTRTPRNWRRSSRLTAHHSRRITKR